MTLDSILNSTTSLWEQAFSIWLSGGWAMIALFINALILFALGVHIYLKLHEKGFLKIPEKTWIRWIDHPKERKGPIGYLINHLSNEKSIKDLVILFKELYHFL